MESWLVVFDRRNEIGTPDRYDQVCVGCVGVQAIGDKSGIFVPRHAIRWERGAFSDKLFREDWHVGHGVMCQLKGVRI